MTTDNSLPHVLTPIDLEMKTLYHHNLDLHDECYFLGRYAVGMGFEYCDNQLILNFKKEMHRRGLPEWHYKARAINTIATAMRAAISPLGLGIIRKSTFVPIPPSKARSDPGYDDRMTKMLQAISTNPRLDVREIVTQSESTIAAHAASDRLGSDDIADLYGIDETVVLPTPERIVIVDDVITTGAHFRATKQVLSTRIPDAAFIGIFVARSVNLEVEDTDLTEFPL